MMVIKGLTLFDGIAFYKVGDESIRQDIINFYKEELGITEIRGLPVEDRVVVGDSAAKKATEKVWAAAIAAEKARKGK